VTVQNTERLAAARDAGRRWIEQEIDYGDNRGAMERLAEWRRRHGGPSLLWIDVVLYIWDVMWGERVDNALAARDADDVDNTPEVWWESVLGTPTPTDDEVRAFVESALACWAELPSELTAGTATLIVGEHWAKVHAAVGYTDTPDVIVNGYNLEGTWVHEDIEVVLPWDHPLARSVRRIARVQADPVARRLIVIDYVPDELSGGDE
jgi:hypothetical protein